MRSAILIILTLVFLGACTPTQQTEQSQPVEETRATPAPEPESPPSAEAAKPAAEPEMITTRSGLKYVDLRVGKGPIPKQGQTVTVHYTGRFTNGKKFDSSVDRNQPFQFRLGRGEVIKGWDEGVATMRVGGKRKLTVPSGLAYGKRGYPGVIPPDSTLVFEVELLGVR